MPRVSKRKIDACPVCCETLTSQVRRPVSCPACEYAACVQCNKAYLETAVQSQCMQCQQPWNREFVDANFPQAWVFGRYMDHRADVLLDREMAQLPESQALVANYNVYVGLSRQMQKDQEEKDELYARIEALNRNRWNLQHRMDRIRAAGYSNDGLNINGDNHDETARESKAFVRGCPVDECRGFLSTALKCGTCQSFACARCFAPIGKDREAPHECKPEEVATAKLLKKDSKPCPKCAVMIFKIDGCSQMWCTMCHTAFDWRTGREVVNGTIHNPHYYAYLRSRSANGEIPRNPGDIPGGAGRACREGRGLMTAPGFDALLRSRGDTSKVKGTNHALLRCHRTLRHVEHWELRGLAHPDNPPNHWDLRLKYLLRELNRDDMKRELATRDRRREQQIAVRQVLEMVLATAGDLIDGWRTDENQPESRALLNEMKDLFEYANQHLMVIRKRFKYATYIFPMEQFAVSDILLQRS